MANRTSTRVSTVCMLMFGCGGGMVGGETDDDPTGTGDSADDGGSSDGGSDSGDGGTPVSWDVDVLFVVDNSGFFGPEQALLSSAFDDFAAVLDEDGFNYRIAFTTTDNGNPLCFGTPEHGHFVATSCLDRIGDFTFSGAEVLDYSGVCQEACSTPGLATTDEHPWIEVTPEGTNLPAGVDVAEAMRCFGLPGINGCGNESPLGSAARSVDRIATGSEREFGFFRETSTVAIVFLTDEADCSHTLIGGSIFEADGDRTFWSDPVNGPATSAVCWNAGVVCTGGPGTYDTCESANKDALGNVGVSEEDSVMIPVSFFVSTFQALQESGSHRIVVAGLAGVPPGYAEGTAEIQYNDGDDPEFVADYGIGPGCVLSAEERAIPPVRLREFVEAFAEPGERNLYSICAEDYAPALRSIAETIRARARG